MAILISLKHLPKHARNFIVWTNSIHIVHALQDEAHATLVCARVIRDIKNRALCLTSVKLRKFRGCLCLRPITWQFLPGRFFSFCFCLFVLSGKKIPPCDANAKYLISNTDYVV